MLFYRSYMIACVSFIVIMSILHCLWDIITYFKNWKMSRDHDYAHLRDSL